jgi:hypothetical protein
MIHEDVAEQWSYSSAALFLPLQENRPHSLGKRSCVSCQDGFLMVKEDASTFSESEIATKRLWISFSVPEISGGQFSSHLKWW